MTAFDLTIILVVLTTFTVGICTIIYGLIRLLLFLFAPAKPLQQPPLDFFASLKPLEDPKALSIKLIEKLVAQQKLSPQEAEPVLKLLREELAAFTPQAATQTQNSATELPPPLPVEETVSAPALQIVTPQSAPAEVATVPPLPPSPRPQRKSLAQLLGGFLESKNILLGELLGGLLIVGGSMALVATLWNTLEQFPFFPFLMLAGISWLLFGAGQYTLHHWKLESTSRGMLMIGLLLHLLANRILSGSHLETQTPLLAGVVSLSALAGLLFQSRLSARDLFEPSLAKKLPWLMLLSNAFLFAPNILSMREATPTLVGGVLLALLVGVFTIRSELPNSLQLILFTLLVFFSHLTSLSSLMMNWEPSIRQSLALPVAMLGLPLLLVSCKPTSLEKDFLSLAPRVIPIFGQLLLAMGVFLAWDNTNWLTGSLAITSFALCWSQRSNLFPLGGILASLQVALLAMLGVHLANGSLASVDPIPPLGVAKILLTAPTQFALLVPGIFFAVLAWKSKCHTLAAGWSIGFWIQATICVATSWAQEEGPQHADLLPQCVFAIVGMWLHFRCPRPAFAFLGMAVLLGGFWGRLFPNPPLHEALVLLGAEAMFAGLVFHVVSTRTPAKSNLKSASKLLASILTIAFLPLCILQQSRGITEPLWTGLALLEGAGAFFLLAWQEGKPWLGRVGYLLAFLAGQVLLKDHPRYFYAFSTGSLLVGSFAMFIQCVGRLKQYLDQRWENGLENDALRLQKPALMASLVCIALEAVVGIPRSHQSFPLAILFDWFGMLCLLRALLHVELAWFRGFQLALTISVMFLSITWSDNQKWDLGNYISPTHPWFLLPIGDQFSLLFLHPRYVTSMLTWLAGLSLGWAVLRYEARNSMVFRTLWFDTRRAVDEWQMLLLGLVLTAVALVTSVGDALAPWGLGSQPTWLPLFMEPAILPAVGFLFLACVVALREQIIFTRQLVLFLCGAFLATYLGQHLHIAPSRLDSLFIAWSAWMAIVCWLNGWRSSILPWFQQAGFKLQQGELGSRPVRLHLFLMASLLVAWKVAEFLALLPTGGEYQPFVPMASWGGVIIAFAGWLVLALRQKYQTQLAWAFWLVMIQSGISYLHHLLHTQLHDHAALVPGMQMMVFSGAIFLTAWAFLQKWHPFHKPDASMEFACLSLGTVMAGAILPGILSLTQGAATPHAFTQEAGGPFAWISLVLGLAAYFLARMLSLGMIPWRGLFLAGFAFLCTLSCRLENREAAFGATILTLAGSAYLLLWSFAFAINHEKKPLRIIDLANLQELTGILQGLGLFLLFLDCWLGVVANKPASAAWGILLLSLASLSLAFYRSSDRHAANSFWLASLAGYFLAAHQGQGLPWIDWRANAFFTTLSAASFQTIGWVLLKNLQPKWQARFEHSTFEKYLIPLPLVAWSIHAGLGLASLLTTQSSGFSEAWMKATITPQGWLAMPCVVLSALLFWKRSGLPIGNILALAAFATGWVVAVPLQLALASHESILARMAQVWVSFGIAVSLAGWLRSRLGLYLALLQDSEWPGALNLLGVASFFAGASLIVSGNQDRAWAGYYILIQLSLQLFLQSAWLKRSMEAGIGIMIALMATLLLCIVLQWTHWLDLAMVGCLCITSFALLLLLRRLIEGTLDIPSELLLQGLIQVATVLICAATLAAYWQGMLAMEPTHQQRLVWFAIGLHAGTCIAGWVLAPMVHFSAGFFATCLVIPIFWMIHHHVLGMELMLNTAFAESLGFFSACGLLLLLQRTHIQLLNWLPPWQATISGLLLLMSLWTSWNGEGRQERLIGAVSGFLIAPTSLFLAWAELARARSLRREFLLYNLAAITLVFQAIPHANESGTWVERAAWFQISCLLLTTLSRLMLRKFRGVWEFAHQLIKDKLPLVAFISVLLTIVFQAVHLDPEKHQSLLHDPLALGVFLASALLGFGSLVRAIRLDSTRINAPTWVNTKYIWGFLIPLAAMLAHVRLCRPDWFQGWMGKYWAFGAILVAMLAGGLGSWLGRRGMRSIANPILATGVLLPTAPLMAFWVKVFLADHPNLPNWAIPIAQIAFRLEGDFGSYSGLWLLTAVFWGWIALDKKSLRLGFSACLALLAAFWSLWQAFGLGFLVHPQLWLIPPAMGLLSLEIYLRGKVPARILLPLRYAGLATLYASSTTELLMRGIAASIWLPVALAFWSVMGVLAGMMFRTRAFLYFGLVFLILDIGLMIWHAAVDLEQTWIWWASVVILGGIILAMFTLFEKRKQDIRQWLDRLHKWD